MRIQIYILLLTAALVLAINPPNKGKFPKQMLEALKNNPEFIKYGDAGWTKKLASKKHYNSSKLSKISAVDNFHLPVLLGDFSDNTGVFSAKDFQNLLFENNPTGTMTNYYNEISYGQLNLTGTVYGWYHSNQVLSYYEAEGNGYGGTFPANAKGFVYTIVQSSDASVDYSLYDNDGIDGIPNSGDDDGYADAVAVVYAGAGAEWFPGNSSFWPHMSSLGGNEYITNDVSANGGNIKVNTYFICPEEAGGGQGNGTIRQIGVFAHEFGHVLGLPDLYDRTDSNEGPDFEDSEGIGEWCLMAGGSWGGDGAHSETPAHMSAWCKYQMGWVEPVLIDQPQTNFLIPQVATSGKVFKLWEDQFELSRYFLIENRQKTGYDQYLNGDGLLIYHVDENRRYGSVQWSSGYINDDETHKLVDVEEADGFANLDNSINRGDSGDPFPGSSNNTSFTDFTTPSAKDYQAQASGVAINNISSSGANMTADIIPKLVSGYSLMYDESGLTGWGWGFADPADSWGGVTFTASESGILKAVDVGFRDINTNYEVAVYSSFSNNSPSGLLDTISGSVVNSGWYTFNFNDEIVIQENQTFFVSVKIESKAHAIAFDPFGPKSGRAYFSGDGTNYFSSIGQSGDINLRTRIEKSAPTALIDHQQIRVKDFTLYQNYPNPFNPNTKIRFDLPQTKQVEIGIYNAAGERIKTLINKTFNAGSHTVNFDGSNFSSGLYFYIVRAGGYLKTQKMLLIK